MKSIILAIMFLAPGLGPTTTKKYAKIIDRISAIHQIDPLLAVTIIHVETAKTWRRKARSTTHDFGLMQVHVSTTTNPGLIGNERVLYDPEVNIRYGIRILAMWRNYHNRACTAGRHRHPYWAHYKWGYKVGEISHAIKVKALYEILIKKFREKEQNKFFVHLDS